MTKTFCDRCKKEITNDIIIYHFQTFEGNSCEFTEIDVCDDCYNAFESFMKMEDSMYHANDHHYKDILNNPGNNHGIERTTFSSR